MTTKTKSTKSAITKLDWFAGSIACIVAIALCLFSSSFIPLSLITSILVAVATWLICNLINVLIFIRVSKIVQGRKALKTLCNYIKLLLIATLLATTAQLVLGLLTLGALSSNLIACLLALAILAAYIGIFCLLRAMQNQLADYKKQETQKAASAPSQLDVFAILGIPPQYNKDGSLKTVYQMVGIKPQYNKEGKRVLTIYEKLGINPLFRADGTEVPYVLRIKNRARAFAKPLAAPIDLFYKPRPRATGKDGLPHGTILPSPDGSPDKPKSKNPNAPVIIVMPPKKDGAKPPAKAPVIGGKDTILGGKPEFGKVNATSSKSAPIKSGGEFGVNGANNSVFSVGTPDSVAVVTQTDQPKDKSNASTVNVSKATPSVSKKDELGGNYQPKASNIGNGNEPKRPVRNDAIFTPGSNSPTRNDAIINPDHSSSVSGGGASITPGQSPVYSNSNINLTADTRAPQRPVQPDDARGLGLY